MKLKFRYTKYFLQTFSTYVLHARRKYMINNKSSWNQYYFRFLDYMFFIIIHYRLRLSALQLIRF